MARPPRQVVGLARNATPLNTALSGTSRSPVAELMVLSGEPDGRVKRRRRPVSVVVVDEMEQTGRNVGVVANDWNCGPLCQSIMTVARNGINWGSSRSSKLYEYKRALHWRTASDIGPTTSDEASQLSSIRVAELATLSFQSCNKFVHRLSSCDCRLADGLPLSKAPHVVIGDTPTPTRTHL